ncbi:MAG TPA: DUF479 domain-containing protein, partial [Phaeodactylibacter sp.]|nr:DUF479 domain-containing protein [Phaeodactylibacter sp.]
LEKRINDLPKKLQKRLPLMIQHQWLQAYQTEEGMRFTFKKLSERVSKPEYLENVVEHLLENEIAFTEEFNSFFPEMILRTV